MLSAVQRQEEEVELQIVHFIHIEIVRSVRTTYTAESVYLLSCCSIDYIIINYFN